LPENRLDDVEYISIDSKDLSELDIPDFEKYIEENKIVIVNSKNGFRYACI
jgi:beta-glucosidase-like glycosyl hydrolase